MAASYDYRISWKAPSNIALVKYWGKKGQQLPENSSLGLTLRSCYTQTNLCVTGAMRGVEFTYKGRKKDEFLPKIKVFFSRVFTYYPELSCLGYRIDSFNTFPHSAGIASSASFFASLALCLTNYLEKLKSRDKRGNDFFKKASFLARLGSGSAARSLFQHASLWGKTDIVESSDEYAVPFELTETFKHYHDSIVIVSRKRKLISSSQGHILMNEHPDKSARYERAKKHLESLVSAMGSNDLNTFCDIVETEALDLHRLMRNAKKEYIFIQPETLTILHKVKKFRKQSALPLCFTLDAGPNVHLLYPDFCKKEVHDFLEREIQSKTPFPIIDDGVGAGPYPL